MGSGSSSSSIRQVEEELQKPLDASDVDSPRGESAKAEVIRLRRLLFAEHGPKLILQGGEEEEDKAKVIAIAVVVRHGHRGPNIGEIESFGEVLGSQWDRSELENLTSTGHEQLRSLGRWFRRQYLDTNSGIRVSGDADFRWRSSSKERARQSGEDFVAGFKEDTGVDGAATGKAGLLCDTPTPPPEDNTVDDDYFRPWATHKGYKHYLVALRSEDSFLAKAKENESFLRDVASRVGFEYTTAAEALYGITKIFAVHEAELYWPRDDTSRSRNALSQILTEDDVKRVTELSFFVWECRFINSGWGPTIGGRLLSEIAHSLTSAASSRTAAAPPQPSFMLYSGHDYTVLSLLTALGVPDRYPRPKLGFACHLIFELLEGGSSSGDNRVRIVLNAEPFRALQGDENDNTVVDNRKVLATVDLRALGTLIDSFAGAILGAQDNSSKISEQDTV